MNKQEFLTQLRKGLSGLPQEDIEERLTFYSEMIEDQIEEGRSEEEALSTIGSIDEIVTQTVAEIPLTKISKERKKTKKQRNGIEILLLVLGAPLWISLAIAVLAASLSLYVSLWSVVVSLWSVFVSLTGCAFGAFLSGAVFACKGNVLPGVAIIGAGILCAGLSIFMFYGCKVATKGILILTKKIAVWIKGCLLKKEGAQ